MLLLGLGLALLLFAWTQLLPGYLVGRALLPTARGAERLLLTLVASLSVVPLALFLLSCLGHVPMDRSFILAGASLINVAGLLAFRPWREPDLGARDVAVLAGSGFVATAFLLFGYRSIDAGDALTTIQHCLYVVSLHGIANDPSAGLPLFDNLSDDFIHFVIHHDTEGLNGFVSLVYEQRLGNVPVLGYPVATLGMPGFLVSAVHASLVTGYALWLTARELGVGRPAAGLAVALFSWGSHAISGYYVNENAYALALVSVLMWAALRRSTDARSMVLLGLLAGHLIGIRDTSSLFLPACVVAAFWQPGPLMHRARRFSLGLTCAIAAGAPWLWINAVALGNPFTDPKIQVDSGGRVVENALLGWSFLFKPLNWPFTEQVVRTVWLPFPTFVWLPLLVGKCYGQLSVAVAALGSWRLFREPPDGRRRAFVLLALFAGPHWLALSALEGLDWEQVTYILPGLAPLGVALAVGLEALFTRERRGRHLVFAAVASGLVISGSRALRTVDAPVDMRLLAAPSTADNVARWREAPPRSAGVELLAQQLTTFSPLPLQPVWRTSWAWRMATAVAAIAAPPTVPVVDALPVYPTQSAVVLSAFSQGKSKHYEFEIAGGPVRTQDSPFRTAVWVHTLAFQLKAQRLRVHVVRNEGAYVVELTPIGESTELRDFTFWLNPWYPPIESITTTLGGRPVEGLRELSYGGRAEDGERLLIVTNYGPEVMDLVEVPYTVDPVGLPTGCGILVFLTGDVNGHRIETFSPAAMDLRWHGELEGTLLLPKNLVADQLVLFSEPYCSDHVPQYGDAFGVYRGRLDGSEPLHIRLDGLWSFE